ncbi:MAG: DUF2071 domain-containing protein, partial [Verrucomicrobiota bacterium]
MALLTDPLDRVDHRPWPVPNRRWSMRQSWHDLLFAHWPVPAELLQPLVPPQLQVQEFEGTSWVGVVPFRMSGVAPRGVPDVPWLSAFEELNLRIYVKHRTEGKPGVWFFSLDAANPIAVQVARTGFHLPYYWAKMQLKDDGEVIEYDSVRKQGGFGFRGQYQANGGVYTAKSGDLDHWLTERYCLYAQSKRGRLYRG